MSEQPELMSFEEGRYGPVLAEQERSPTLREIYRVAYGPDYPEEADPFGFVTRTDLRRIVELLEVGPGATLADLGCGRGGPGLWVARQTSASLIGLDIVPEAVAQAERRAAAFGLAGARFMVASFVETRLPDACCRAVMSVDALWMVLDKPAALAEVARILEPGGRLVLTTWEPRHVDHLALLGRAGLEVLVREETPDWMARQLAVYEGILAARDRLAGELGPAATAVLVNEAMETRLVLPETPRLLLAARKPGGGPP